MDLDLNIELVVEGDEAELNEFFDLIEDIQEQVDQQDDYDGQQAEEVDLNAPASLGYVFTPISVMSSPKLPDDLENLEEVPIMLALQAPPVNFSVEEIQEHELLNVNNMDPVSGKSSSAGSVGVGNLQVGMALLPDNLDIDLVFSGLSEQNSLFKNNSAEGFRLLATYFDAPGSCASNLVPASWKEFFIASLLNPSSFDWAKSFLNLF
jgi:hypothetical protein